MSVDLHMHTTASDGTFRPRRLVKRAVKKGVRVIAITDHDTTGGLDEACEEATRWSIDIIPGIEINTEYRGREVHVLGYFIDVANDALRERLTTVRRDRETRMGRILTLLQAQGCDVTEADVMRFGKGESIGRPHVAQALVAKKHAVSVSDAFERWLARDRPAYVARESLTPREAIALIRGAGGVPVLAHPCYVDGESLIEELIADGLGGLEVRYPSHSPTHVQRFADMAKAHGIGMSGGSDFHGPQIKRIDVGEIDFSLTDLRLFCEKVGREVPRLARSRPS